MSLIGVSYQTAEWGHPSWDVRRVNCRCDFSRTRPDSGMGTHLCFRHFSRVGDMSPIIWGHTSLSGILLLSEECPRIIKL
jgi:hypothetical protein